MKKLMVMMGAVATALGLFAEAGTVAPYSFEADASDPGVRLESNTFTPSSDQGWTWAGDPLSLGTYAGDAYVYPSEGPMARRNSSWTTQNKFLKLETDKEVLGLGLKKNVFVDQLVKFTGFEEYPTEFAAGTKIAVWMSAIESDDTADIVGETNLYVSVGTGSGTTKVKADVTVQPEKWYRLTIKSLGDVIGDGSATAVGFIIYLDGEPLKFVDNYYAAPGSLSPAVADYYTSKTLFISMDKTSNKVASVGYQGIGGIDDIVIDSVGPDFAGEVEINIDSLALNGAKVIKIGDVTITDQTSLKVRPGDILVSYAANGPYIVKNGEGVKWTVAADGTLVKDTAATIEIIEAAAKITRGGVYTYYAADELDATIAQVQDGDKVTFLKDCTLLEGAYSFTPNTTIDVEQGGKWTVYVANYQIEGEEGPETVAGSLIDTFGAMPGKDIKVSFENVDGTFTLMGLVQDNDEYSTTIDVQSGNLYVGETGLTVGCADGIGAVVKAANISFYKDEESGENSKITLVGKGKVITKSGLTANSFGLASASDLKVELDAGTGYYTYSLNATPTPTPTTGFMVILAGQTEGVYQTLAEAVNVAPNGSTIKMLSNGTATAKVDVTKNITLDLNGKTLARDNNAATLFVIKDATLTINGATAGSALVGRLNVGDSVYNGGERTAHWDGKLVINGGTYSVGNGQTVIHVNGDCQDAAVTINNATLTSPTDNGVQFNGKGTFAINNSTINGATAVYMKAGTLTIDKDSKINATAETWTAPVANHNGSNPTGDAIVMDSTTGYQGAISLTVADGAQVTKVAEGAATIRETITDATESTTVKIDAPTIGGIALTEAFLAKVANGSAQLPGYVAAIGTVPYQTLAAAFAAAQAGSTIKMLSDAVLTAWIGVNKNVTLDLNGKKVTGTLPAGQDALFAVNRGGTFTITDGATGGEIDSGSVMCALKLTQNAALDYVDPATYTDANKATLVVNGGTIKGFNYAIGGNGNPGRGNTAVTINGGTIMATAPNLDNAEKAACAIYNPQENSTLTITGGTISGYQSAVEIRAGTLAITGGTLTATAAEYAVVGNGNGPSCTGAALVISEHVTKKGITAEVQAIENATLTGVKSVAIVNPQGNTESQVTVTLGKATYNGALEFSADAIATVTKTEAAQIAAPAGYEWDANGVLCAIEYVAQIGDVKYETLQSAFAAAKDGETVEMLANVSLAANEKVVIMDKAVTLAGAFTVTAAGRAFNVQKGGTLTISSETTVIGTGTPATIFLWPYDFDSRALTSDDAAHYGKAKLVVNGTVMYTTAGNEGAISSNGNDSIAESKGVEVIINGTVINECDSALYLPGKGTCTVNDGAYIEGTYAGIQMKAVTLTVNGGTIKATGEDQTPTALWSNGAKPSGCAIQMEGNTAYAGGINLTVNGGTIESVNAKAIYAYGAKEKFGTISIAGGTIKGNTGVFLLDKGMNKAIVPGTSKAQFNQDVTDFCEEGYETVKLESAQYYTVRAKQTDQIPPLPDNPTADDVNAAVEAAKFVDSTVKTMIGGDPTKYNAFKTWAGTVSGGEAAVVKSAHAADSYLLGQTTLLANALVSEIKTIAKTSDTALTLTFVIKDGANAVAVADSASAKAYVASIVQCNEKVDFGNGTKIDATVTVTINGTTLTAAVTLPPNKPPAAFMKVGK